ncbi:uncharacterized protein LOC132546817 [Ylistrum balloti]|uniref:uncharacterized protein LOC132546817 n=1 Tax=Ylistrum balloti TaxID=509963 RepID=UPI0029059E0D|nr:uncharacterized protein LOC132546817 [Ylistrum balloti]
MEKTGCPRFGQLSNNCHLTSDPNDRCCQKAACTPVGPAQCRNKLAHCENYGQYACNEPYKEWAKENCNQYCGFCGNTGVTTTVSTACVDRLPNCKDYGTDSCIGQYIGWAKFNCPVTCNYCRPSGTGSVGTGTGTIGPGPSGTGTSGTGSGNCKDSISNCKDYTRASCVDPYASWALTHCPHFCGLCDQLTVSGTQGGGFSGTGQGGIGTGTQGGGFSGTGQGGVGTGTQGGGFSGTGTNAGGTGTGTQGGTSGFLVVATIRGSCTAPDRFGRTRAYTIAHAQTAFEDNTTVHSYVRSIPIFPKDVPFRSRQVNVVRSQYATAEDLQPEAAVQELGLKALSPELVARDLGHKVLLPEVVLVLVQVVNIQANLEVVISTTYCIPKDRHSMTDARTYVRAWTQVVDTTRAKTSRDLYMSLLT